MNDPLGLQAMRQLQGQRMLLVSDYVARSSKMRTAASLGDWSKFESLAQGDTNEESEAVVGEVVSTDGGVGTDDPAPVSS